MTTGEEIAKSMGEEIAKAIAEARASERSKVTLEEFLKAVKGLGTISNQELGGIYRDAAIREKGLRREP